MRKTLLASLLVAVSAAVASDWELSFEPTPTKFAVFRGGLGDPVPPTREETRIAFEVKGKAARQMFDAMGPDRKDACGATEGMRYRSRDNDRLVCTLFPKGDYTCYFGFDLKTGRSVGGSVC